MVLKRLLKKLFPDRQNADINAFCRKALGFTPHNIEVYRIALTHKSLMQEAPDGHKVNNERLEYLGDAMLGAIVAEHLYVKYPDRGEGFLTELRSKIVSRRNLNKVAHKMGLHDLLAYDHSNIHINENRTLEGNALEALIGALYIDRGYSVTRRIIVERMIKRYVDIDTLATTNWNYKGMLLDYCQKRHSKLSFVIDRTERIGHDRHAVYYVHVDIDGQEMESANGLSIKSAEQLAAEKTYKRLNEQKKRKKQKENGQSQT